MPNLPPSLWLLLIVILIFAALARAFRSAGMKGTVGQWWVKQMLNRKLDRTAYHCLHDLLIPDGRNGLTQIDHVVVSRWGIFVIETKNYSGWIFGVEEEARWMATYRGGRKESFQNPLRQNRLHTLAIEKLLELWPGQCHGTVFFTGDAVFKKGPVPGVLQSGLVRHIRSFRTEVWDAPTAAALAERLRVACRSHDPQSKANHLPSGRPFSAPKPRKPPKTAPPWPISPRS